MDNIYAFTQSLEHYTFSNIFLCFDFFAIISYTMEHQQAKEEVLQTAKLILEMAVSIRTYTIEEIAPLLKSSSQNKHMP